MNNNSKKSSDYLCAALDGFDLSLGDIDLIDAIYNRLIPISNDIGWVKVGMELFYSSYGKCDVLKIINNQNLKIFLDLKLKDIALDTIKNTSGVLTAKGVDMFNIHADGTFKMMRAAIEGADSVSQNLGIERPKIIGVTVLTSMDEDDLKEIGINSSMNVQVLRLALLAQKSGLDGIVCSALDLEYLKTELPDDFIFVTPGIRLPKGDATGQSRVATPDFAIEQGATHLVVGRPIYSHKQATEQQNVVSIINKMIQSGLLKLEK